MGKKAMEWLKQADYDLDTAKCMFDSGRCFYAVFMCHLSIEKALKGLYQEQLQDIPPKVHNLVYLLNKIGIKPAEQIGKFMIQLNEASVTTRYPEDLEKLQNDFTYEMTKNIIDKSKEVLTWIKKQF